MVKKEIKIIATLDPHKKCILIYGDGASSIKFDADATQLAPVLTALADFKGCTIELILRKGKERGRNAGFKKQSKTYR